ncbi:MAG: hypothetical protein H6R19_3252 [Proteobacteria bacterium]|nr:hypothetical protein [Pseudomonadota bacterium]
MGQAFGNVCPVFLVELVCPGGCVEVSSPDLGIFLADQAFDIRPLVFQSGLCHDSRTAVGALLEQARESGFLLGKGKQRLCVETRQNLTFLLEKRNEFIHQLRFCNQ